MLDLERLVGFEKGVRGGLAFSHPSTLLYLAGRAGVQHRSEDGSQRFFRIHEECSAMALGRHLLALASKSPARVLLYSQKTAERHGLAQPEGFRCSEYMYLTFSANCEYLGGLGGTPTWSFVVWQVENRNVFRVFYPFRLEQGAKIYKFSFDPDASSDILGFGRRFLRLYRSGSHVYREEPFHEMERHRRAFHCLAWTEGGRFVVGTSDGRILIFRQKRLIQQFIVGDMLAEVPRILNKIKNSEDMNIFCLLSTQTGLICSYGGSSVLCMRWKIDRRDLNVVASIHAPEHEGCSAEGSKIVQLTLNSNEDRLAAATQDGQILTFSFAVPGLLGDLGYEADFETVLHRQHVTPVRGADTSADTAMHVTCSSSGVILWDYKKRNLFFWTHFKDDIRNVSIHPLGLNLLIGFEDCSKLYAILNSGLREVKQFDSKGNVQNSFSKGGHMVAIGNESSIEVYLLHSFEKYCVFEKHDGKVTSMVWGSFDRRLLSVDEAGQIHEWDLGLRGRTWLLREHSPFCHALATLGDTTYAATSDAKICSFVGHQKACEVDTRRNVTSLLATERTLFVGNDCGAIFGYSIPLSDAPQFEVHYHKGCILNMTTIEGGALLMATGGDGVVSIWRIRKGGDAPVLYDEILMERKSYNQKLNEIAAHEKEYRLREAAAEFSRSEQRRLQEEEIGRLQTLHEDVENQLKRKILMLTHEKYDLRMKRRQSHFDEVRTRAGHREENYADFQTKKHQEEKHYQNLVTERSKSVESYELQLHSLKEEILRSDERNQIVKARNEARIQELEDRLRKEVDERHATLRRDEAFYSRLEGEAGALSQGALLRFASELERVAGEGRNLEQEAERLRAQLSHGQECGRALDAESGRKEAERKALSAVVRHVKGRLEQAGSGIERKDSVLEDKVAMIGVLQEDCAERDHLNSECDRRRGECEVALKTRSRDLEGLADERRQLQSDLRNSTKKLRAQQREQFVLEEKLKASEKSIQDNAQKTIEAQSLVERFQKEFREATEDVGSTVTLRWNLLLLYDKRSSIKEEEMFAAPFPKFCRQRDHYESLINTSLNRKQEIEGAFRLTYVALAKENSDWTAFLGALRSDLGLKLDRIRALEGAVGLPSSAFPRDPADTQKRFAGACRDLESSTGEEEVRKRMRLIETQAEELRRLHGILVEGGYSSKSYPHK